MGKRNRKSRQTPKPASASQPGKNANGTKKSASASEPKKSGTTLENVDAAATVRNLDISEDCVMYESPNEEMNANAAEGPESEPESSADEMELAAPEATNANADSDVEVTFDFYDPREGDASAIADFLTVLCRSVSAKSGVFERMALARTVCAQTRVGTVVKISEDSPPIGFITALAVELHRKLLAPLGVRLRSAGAPASILRAFDEPTQDAPKSPRVGVIFGSRVVNMPPPVVPKMWEALLYEIKWAKEDEPTEELRKSYDFRWFVYITDVYPAGAVNGVSAPAASKKPPKKKVRTKQAQEKANDDDDEEKIAFTRVEDAVLLDAATHTVNWSIPGEEAGPEGLVRRKMAMFIKAPRMEQAFEAITKLFGIQSDEPEAGEQMLEAD